MGIEAIIIRHRARTTIPEEEVVFLLIVVSFHLSEHFIYPGIIVDTFAEVERKYRLAGRPRDNRVTCGLYLSIISPPVRKSNSESGAPINSAVAETRRDNFELCTEAHARSPTEHVSFGNQCTRFDVARESAGASFPSLDMS